MKVSAFCSPLNPTCYEPNFPLMHYDKVKPRVRIFTPADPD